MPNKSRTKREAKHRLEGKYDSRTFASPEAAAEVQEAAGLLEVTVGEILAAGEPSGSPRIEGGQNRWRAGDIRSAAAAVRQWQMSQAAPIEEVPAEEAVAPIAEMTGAPEAVEVPEIIEVRSESVPEESEILREARREAAEVLEGLGIGVEAPGLGERIRGLFSIARKVVLVGARSVVVGVLLGIAVLAGLTVRFNWTAGYRDPVVLGIFSMFAIVFGGFAGILAYHWRPSWSWLRMPKVRRPRISRPSWLAWGKTQQRVAAFAILAVVLVVVVVLWQAPAPTTEPAVVPTTIATATVEPTATREPTKTPAPTATPTVSAAAVVTPTTGITLTVTAAVSPTVPVTVTAVAPVTPTIVVVGRVLDQNRQQVAGAQVFIGTRGTDTFSSGTFELPGIPEAEEYTLVIRFAETDHEVVRGPVGKLTVPGRKADVGEISITVPEPEPAVTVTVPVTTTVPTTPTVAVTTTIPVTSAIVVTPTALVTPTAAVTVTAPVTPTTAITGTIENAPEELTLLYLVREDKVIADAAVSDEGGFSFAGVPGGKYDLRTEGLITPVTVEVREGEPAEVLSLHQVVEDETLWNNVYGAHTWEEYKAFAEAHGLMWKINDRGTPDDASDDLLVVIIQPGQVFDLAAMSVPSG